jgi:hypothetical protein
MAQPGAASQTNGLGTWGPYGAGITPLHLAVLEGSYSKVRSIVRSGKHGVNAQTVATRTTPLMLAALYGRSDIFLYLLKKKASPGNRDSQGNTSLQYAEPRSPFFKDLLRQYGGIAATRPPSTSMRRDIFILLNAIRATRHKSKKAYAKGRADGRAEVHSQSHSHSQAQSQSQSHPQAQAQAPMVINQIGQQQQQQQQYCDEPAPTRCDFLPSRDGKRLEFVQGRCTASILRVGRSKSKCIGLICGPGAEDGGGGYVQGESSHMFAVSGWGTTTRNNKNDAASGQSRDHVLNNLEYTWLVKRVAGLVGFGLKGCRQLDFVSILSIPKSQLVFFPPLFLG